MAEPEFSIASYRQYLAQRKIMASRCPDSGRIYVPPRPICQDSQSRNMEWIELSGEGKLVAFTSILVPPAAMAKRGYGRDKPYLSGFVSLKEGPTIPARIDSSEKPVYVGMPLTADFVEEFVGEENQLSLVFRPA